MGARFSISGAKLGSTTALALCLASPAYAQTAGQAQGQGARASEVIVPARKRQESILNVPVIETAISQETLQRLQVQDLKDVGRLAPGLLMGQAASNGGIQVSIRGIGTTTNDPAVEQSVALNIDGVQMSQGTAFLAGMFDVGQVEVLKGPQALFYGKGAPGGVISLRTADPSNNFEVIARGMYEFEARTRQGELIVSGPVTDTLKIRLAGQYSKSDGYFYNLGFPLTATGALLPPSDRAPGDKRYIFRTTALWTPTDNFSARLKVNLNEDRATYSNIGQLVSCPNGTVGPAGIPFLGPSEDCKLDRVMRSVEENPAAFPGTLNSKGSSLLQINQKYGSLELNYRLMPEVTLTSVTGYYWSHTLALTPGTGSGFAAPTLDVFSESGRHDWTEEVRVNTEFQGPINVTAGLFYQDSHSWLTGGVGGNVIYRLPALLSNNHWDVYTKAISPFGQVRWNPLAKLEIALGARWTDEKRTANAVSLITGSPIPIPLAVPKIHPKTTAPELTVTYKPDPDVTIFGSLKKGFKSGSFNAGVVAIPGLNNAYGDEHVKGGEAGVKARILDRRATLEAAYFDYRYNGLQVGVVQPGSGNLPPQTVTVNAGSARSYGVDVGATWSPEQVENLDLYFNGQWNRARFKVLNNVPCYGG
jgi:iron complex outermembrane receptor protein